MTKLPLPCLIVLDANGAPTGEVLHFHCDICRDTYQRGDELPAPDVRPMTEGESSAYRCGTECGCGCGDTLGDGI